MKPKSLRVLVVALVLGLCLYHPLRASSVRVQKATAVTKALAAEWTVGSSLPLFAGDTLFVGLGSVASGYFPTVTWNGVALRNTTGQFIVCNTEAQQVCSNLYYLPPVASDGVGDLVLTQAGWNGSGAACVLAVAVSGLATSPLDAQLINASPGSTRPTAGPTPTLTEPNQYLFGFVVTHGPAGDAAGTWGGDILNNGLRVGTTGKAPKSNVTCSEGYTLDGGSTNGKTASKTGITNRGWTALVATFRPAA